jgi:hypothetical protein
MMARLRRSFFEATVAFVLLALMAGVAGYILIGGRHADAAKAESRTTTESAAEAAGARITTTPPKLSVEPK